MKIAFLNLQSPQIHPSMLLFQPPRTPFSPIFQNNAIEDQGTPRKKALKTELF